VPTLAFWHCHTPQRMTVTADALSLGNASIITDKTTADI
jgi:hypothetical protein